VKSGLPLLFSNFWDVGWAMVGFHWGEEKPNGNQ